MKKLHALVWLLLVNCCSVQAQNLIIKGRVKCDNLTANSTRGAKNVIVVPGFNPEQSVFTQSDEKAGFFQLNTGVNYKDLIDKSVAIYVVSRCENCTQLDMNQFTQYKKVFIDQRIDANSDSTTYYMVLKKDWKIPKKCEDIELLREQQASWLRKIQQQPAENIKNTKGNLLMGSPVLTALLTNLVNVAPIFNFGTFFATNLGASKIKYGNYLFNAPLVLSANTGFNFAPSRDMSEAVLWNPSSTVFARKERNISLTTNVKNTVKLSAYTKFGKQFTIGAGVLYTRQDEFRSAEFKRISEFGDTTTVAPDSVQMKLNEFAFYLAPSIKLSSKLSLGVSLKSIHQQLTSPNQLVISQDNNNNAVNTYSDSLVKKHRFDVDISATYYVTNYLQIGVSAMNVLGSQLYADAFVAGQQNLAYRNQRSFGVGLCYKVWRFNVGSDILFTQDNFYDASVGVNFVPFNNALLSAGYTIRQQSYSAAFQIKHVRIAYINDNNLMINELRKPVLPIFNGKIYAGFTFDF